MSHRMKLGWVSTLTALGLVTTVGLATPAAANHEIKPARVPSQLNPSSQPWWGTPGPGSLGWASPDSCDADRFPGRPGTLDLAAYLEYWWPVGTNTEIGSGTCRGSLHDEGRAVDYYLDKNIAAQKKAGDEISWFFRRQDTGGTNWAMAKRFGIQEIIWNCRIWTAQQASEGWRLYYRCDPNHPDHSTAVHLRHENHVHIGQNWAGANQNKTAWTGYKPCAPGHAGCPQ